MGDRWDATLKIGGHTIVKIERNVLENYQIEKTNFFQIDVNYIVCRFNIINDKYLKTTEKKIQSIDGPVWQLLIVKLEFYVRMKSHSGEMK